MLFKNENKGNEMVDIVSHLHQYVPVIHDTDRKTISNGDSVTVNKDVCRPLLFGGDQLTAARARGAKKSRRNSEGMVGKLTGLHPVAEDWHTKANFLEVCTFSIIIHI